jgi:16S rRNA (guanine966-N2)-methyltransferase
VRVVGGEWKGRPLAAPAGRSTRPTSDKVREAVFGMLGSLTGPVVDGGACGASPERPSIAGPSAGPLAGHTVLDLFAGSGALGIEALSRGAAVCTFVENDRAALEAMRRNLERLGLDGAAAARRVRVVAGDARRALQADARRGARYTLVLVDPPYAAYDDVRPQLVTLLPPVLAPGALLVVETAARTMAGLPWRVLRDKRYGDTRVTILAPGEDEDGAVTEHEAPSV